MHLCTTINMVALHSGNRDGVVSMDSQVETVPGPQPQRGPPPATGVSDPEHVAGKGQSRATGYNLNICHWNAEGVRTKHYLQSCSLHQQTRQQIWPTCVSLKTKLWGSAEDLFLTSRYAALMGERI